MRFTPIYGRQAFKVDGKFKFWGGLTVEAVGGGPGLVDMLTDAANKRGIEIRYQHARARSPVRRRWRRGRARRATTARDANCTRKSVVLACGGFEANAEWRTRYLGPGWELAKVRGTRFNTGDGIRMALDDRRRAARQLVGLPRRGLGAATRRSSATSRSATSSRSTPIRSAIMINADGKRFVDEGADFRNYTYAKYGRVILEQPGQFAWQIFDAEGDAPAARRIPHPAGHQGHRQHARGAGAEARRRQRRRSSLKTIAEYNAAVRTDVPFNPNIKDGRRTQGLRDRQVQLGEHASTRRRSRPTR